MVIRMRRVVLLFVLAALALPLAAFAADAPPPAVVAACQQEAATLGKDAFVAKYGPTEPFGRCYAAHTTPALTTTTTTTTSDDPATAACKAEYVKLGPDGFKAKYGATEPFGNCLAAQKQPKPAGDDASKGLAQALCYAEGKALGKDAFLAKYGREALGACVKASLAKARQIVASCTASSGSSRDAFKACLVAAAPPKRR
jgi:hypothetical protein